MHDLRELRRKKRTLQDRIARLDGTVLQEVVDSACALIGKKPSSLAPNRRHACAMELLQSGVDRSVIAPWLGHESVGTTYVCLDADLKLKEAALAKTTSTQGTPDHRHPDDEVLAFLNGL